MFVVCELLDGTFDTRGLPPEVLTTHQAMEWMHHIKVVEGIYRFWVMDVDSYRRDNHQIGKRSSIDLYLIIQKFDSEGLWLIRCVGDNALYTEYLSSFPDTEIDRIAIEINKHCFDYFDPDLSILEIEVNSLIEDLQLGVPNE